MAFDLHISLSLLNSHDVECMLRMETDCDKEEWIWSSWGLFMHSQQQDALCWFILVTDAYSQLWEKWGLYQCDVIDSSLGNFLRLLLMSSPQTLASRCRAACLVMHLPHVTYVEFSFTSLWIEKSVKVTFQMVVSYQWICSHWTTVRLPPAFELRHTKDHAHSPLSKKEIWTIDVFPKLTG